MALDGTASLFRVYTDTLFDQTQVEQNYLATALRMNVGGGVRWFSPLGPLRLEWGYVLDRKPGEEPSQWQFSVGGFF